MSNQELTKQQELTNPELADIEVHGVTRASFMVRGALAAGAVYGTSMVAPFVSQALAAGGGGDVEILNFALTLEYLESAFYNEKGKQVGLSGQAKTYATDFGGQEAEHVAALTAAIKQLGGTPVAKPTFVFPVSNRELVPGPGLDAGEHGSRRLQRSGAEDLEQAGAGRGRQHRADRGASRRRDQPADQQDPHPQRRLRQAPDRNSGARRRQAADQGIVPAPPWLP